MSQAQTGARGGRVSSVDTASPVEIAHALGQPPPTPEQQAVIAAPVEPALVVAGAGAGKTETMASRVVYLVANGIVEPDQVLGLTFTRKAARQLAERVRKRLRRLLGTSLLDDLDPTGARKASLLEGEPTVMTYHAYAGRLLAEHGLRLAVQPGSTLLSETAAWQLAHRVVSTWDGELTTTYVPATVTERLLQVAGELGEHLLDPDRLVAESEALAARIEEAPKTKRQRDQLSADLQKVVDAQRFRAAVVPLVAEYQRRKRAEGALDFADQMALAARLAADHPDVAAGERARYQAVLLDEYQDTGHAQRILLRGLFGAAPRADGKTDKPLPVMAVGDPVQAIYGWRGASAANLPRFTTDFPRRTRQGLEPARRYGLLTSFRNPPEVLALANAVSANLRPDDEELRPRPDAPKAQVNAALHEEVAAERAWLADEIAARWHAAVDDGDKPPTAAVLVRRRADMAPIAAALRDRDVPVEVVGLGGLLDEPEVADLVSTLRVLADPLAGTAAARLLTGARWRLGAADLVALWKRARQLSADAPKGDLVVAEAAETAGLVDAIDDPGDEQAYSAEGFWRISLLRNELRALRRRMDQSLPELVADVERTMLLDVEATARVGATGRVHLDAFADVVTEFAETSAHPTLLSFVDYLAVAEEAEDGLEPGEVVVAEDRVQILTVHAAKGLEWELVAIPHLVANVFPGTQRTGCWLTNVAELPASLRGDAQDLPQLTFAGDEDRKQVQDALADHKDAFKRRHADEERRLCYVALTRSEHTLLCSGHWWNETAAKPSGPSDFLLEIVEKIRSEPDLGTVAHWAQPPEPDAPNPNAERTHEAEWPADPLGGRRPAVEEGAQLVRNALAELAGQDAGTEPAAESDGAPTKTAAEPEEGSAPERPAPEAEDEADPEGWAADTDVLLAERERSRTAPAQVVLPDHLSVSHLVELAGDQEALARKLRRPLPEPPNVVARRGTLFHAWLERRFTQARLLEFDDLPGAADTDAGADAEFEALRDAFEAGQWADRTPFDVEVPFVCEVDGVTLRGRMDAVFADPDGGWTVVDWKTGAVPSEDRMASLKIQLAAYRVAWAALKNVDVDQVRAAFYYVKADHTARPADLLDADGLSELLRAVPVT